MPNASPAPPIEYIFEITDQFNFNLVTQIKVNIGNLPNMIEATRLQQAFKNSYIQFAENDDKIDFSVNKMISDNRDSVDNIEALKILLRESLIDKLKKDVSIVMPSSNQSANPGNSQFTTIQSSALRDYLNSNIVKIPEIPKSQLAIINLGLENFKDEQNTRFFIDAFSQFSQEFQKSVIDLAIANSNFDFIDKFLEYKGDDPEYLLLSATRKNDTTKVRDILTSESSLPHYSLNLFRSTIRLGNLEMTEIILENQREFDTKLFFIGAIKAKNNKFETLNLFLSKITNFNEPIPDVDSSHIAPPIIFSIRKHDIKITNFLLELGANIDIVANSETPLIVAIKMSDIKIIELLLDKGADIDKRPAENGDTPLIYAIRKSKADIAEFLLDRGANFDKLDSLGLSAIHIATKENNFKMVRLLVEKNKGSVNFVVSKGEFEKFTPLHFATLNNNPEMVEFLLNNKAKTEKITKSDKTALHIAVENKNPAIVKLLLAQEVDKKTLNSSLHIAIKNNNPEILKLLLEKGANPNIARSDGLTPIGIAIINRRDDLLSILLESEQLDFNSTIKTGDYRNYTPVHIASCSGNAIALEKLLNKGNAKTRELINGPAVNGMHPIHLATNSKDFETINLLLKNGVNVDQITSDGLTSRDIAENAGAGDEIIRILLKASNKDKKTNKGKPPNHIPPLHYAIMHSEISLIEELITPENINQISSNGFAPLHIACDTSNESDNVKEDIEVIRILLSKGAYIDIEASGNFIGYTPLHFVVFNDNVSIARFLLEENADVNKCISDENLFKETPLFLAIYKNTSIEMISLLLDKGAKIPINIDDEFGNFFDNYIFELIDENREDVVRLLLKNIQENNQSLDYSSLFHFAVSKNRINIVKILLEMDDISFDTPNYEGQTALHVAISNQSTPILIELLKSEKINLNIIAKGLSPIALAQFIDYEEGEKLLMEESDRRDALSDQDALVDDSDAVHLQGRIVYEEIKKISKSLRNKADELATSPPSLIDLLRDNPEEIFSPQSYKNSGTIFQFVATHPECINLLGDMLESLKSSELTHLINENQGIGTKNTENIAISPLYSAVAFGNLEGARLLIEAGAEVNSRVIFGQYSLLEVALKNLKKLEESPESEIDNSKKIETIFAMTSLITGENERSARVLLRDEESEKIIKYLDKIPSQKIRILDILQKNYPENKFFQEGKISQPAPNSNARLVIDGSRTSVNRLDQAKTRFNS